MADEQLMPSPVELAFGQVIDDLAGKLSKAVEFIEKVTSLNTNLAPHDVARVRADARAVLAEIDPERPVA